MSINLQLLHKIDRNRKNNRDAIKWLIKDKSFYSIGFDIVICQAKTRSESIYTTSDFQKEIVENCRLSQNSVFTSPLRCSLRYSNGISFNSLKSNPPMPISIYLTGIIGKLSYDLDNPTTLYYKDYKLLTLYPYKDKYSRIEYIDFDPVKNYPNKTIKVKQDHLAKIINPYYFTGYDFNIGHYVYEILGQKDLKPTDIWYQKGIMENISIKTFNNDQQYGCIQLILPEKYRSWSFASDSNKFY